MLAIGLPLWPLLTSIAQFVLLGNWLLEGYLHQLFPDYKQKIMQKKSIILLASIFGVHLLGTLYSADLQYALHDLQIKLPILVLPLVIGTSKELSNKRFNWILRAFILAVFINTILSSVRFFNQIAYENFDVRNTAFLISHIRLSLLVNIGIISSVYLFAFDFKQEKNKRQAFIYLFMIIWFVLFLFILKSITGIVVLLFVVIFTSILAIIRIEMLVLRFFCISLLLTIPLISLSYLTHQISAFYTVENIDMNNLDTLTAKGNPYYHNFDDKTIENGQYVGLYQCEKEMREAWNKRSNYPYDGKDEKNQLIKFTLIRYLTSKSYRKDAKGVSKLTEKDIRSIENGMANHIFDDKFSLYPRIYQMIWEIDVYRKGGNPSGHSITQRFEYLKFGWKIFTENFWFGVGTGDVENAFIEKYENSNTLLEPKYWRRTHNQFLTFALTFGIIGFLWIFFALIYPFFAETKKNNYLFSCMLIVSFLSMLNEDTLETQTGVSYFMFFYVLFLYKQKRLFKKAENRIQTIN